MLFFSLHFLIGLFLKQARARKPSSGWHCCKKPTRTMGIKWNKIWCNQYKILHYVSLHILYHCLMVYKTFPSTWWIEASLLYFRWRRLCPAGVPELFAAVTHSSKEAPSLAAVSLGDKVQTPLSACLFHSANSWIIQQQYASPRQWAGIPPSFREEGIG